MECVSCLDWLLNWKTTLYLANGCFGLALLGFGLSFHRKLTELKKQTSKMAGTIETIIAKGGK